MSRYLSSLQCSACSRHETPSRLQNLCPHCGAPLLARYDLSTMARETTRPESRRGEPTLWRYFDILPVADKKNLVSLGEGWTPLLQVPRLGKEMGLPGLLLKDEGQNPTGTFKDRGTSVAMTRAIELGARAFTLGSSGNAGSSWAAYAARAGVELHLAVLRKSPDLVKAQCYLHGTRLYAVDGFIREASAAMSRGAERYGWFDVSTLREPYRIEGKKTMGLEIAEQLGWEPPDAIIYPAGGGVGLIGIWKAIQELGELGWIGPKRPRMVLAQSDGCAPLVKAFEEGRDSAEPWGEITTRVSILRATKPLGDRLVLRALRESGGTAVAVSDEEMLWGMEALGTREGVLACPEGGATVAAARRLAQSGYLSPSDRVVVVNTGTALKRMELVHPSLRVMAPDEEVDPNRAAVLTPRKLD